MTTPESGTPAVDQPSTPAPVATANVVDLNALCPNGCPYMECYCPDGSEPRNCGHGPGGECPECRGCYDCDGCHCGDW